LNSGGSSDIALGNVFGLRLHNQPDKAFLMDGRVDRLLFFLRQTSQDFLAAVHCNQSSFPVCDGIPSQFYITI
ncbi:hypothetical protein EV421DRAFT_1721669, partial [Armillaria borealis]